MPQCISIWTCVTQVSKHYLHPWLVSSNPAGGIDHKASGKIIEIPSSLIRSPCVYLIMPSLRACHDLDPG